MSIRGKFFLGLSSLIYSSQTIIRFLFLKQQEQLNKDSDVVVSLTTFPPRIKHVILTLKSILTQSVKPNQVILYLSKDEFGNQEIPVSLLKLKKYGVTIEFVDGNIKSYKKLLYAKKTYPKKNIVTADDDVCYPFRWLENLIKESKKNPDDIIFYRGHLMCDQNRKLLPYKKMLELDSSGVKSSFDFLPTGIGGILYPPESMHQDWDNMELINKLAPNADDIWFKAMTLLSGRKCTRVNDFNILFPPVLGSQKQSLKKINVDSSENNNDKQLNMVFKYYGLMGKIYDI